MIHGMMRLEKHDLGFFVFRFRLLLREFGGYGCSESLYGVKYYFRVLEVIGHELYILAVP